MLNMAIPACPSGASTVVNPLTPSKGQADENAIGQCAF